MKNAKPWTRYALALSQGLEPTGDLFQEAWEALYKGVRKELSFRRQLNRSPSFLGVYGYSTWTQGAPGTARAIDEFLQDCFSFIFVERIPQLIARLRVHPDIEGDVKLYIRNFVHSRQRHHDPLGSRLFSLLQAAVRDAVDSGNLFIIGGDPAIRNDTVLAFQPRSPTKPNEELGSLTVDWASGAIGDLFSTGPGSRQKAVERLRLQLLDLESHSVDSFLFQAAIDGLKQDVRAQLAVLFELEQGEAVLEVDEHGNRTWIRTLKPETWVEDIDSYNKLVDCVTKFVRAEQKERTRRHLETLWGFVRNLADSAEERFPASRKIESLLGVPRARVGGLLETLQGFVTRCSGGGSGTVVDGHFRDRGRP